MENLNNYSESADSRDERMEKFRTAPFTSRDTSADRRKMFVDDREVVDLEFVSGEVVAAYFKDNGETLDENQLQQLEDDYLPEILEDWRH